MGKQTVELMQTRMCDGDGPLYRVVKLTNTLQPTVGEHLSGPEVREYIRRPGWTVIVKEGKGA